MKHTFTLLLLCLFTISLTAQNSWGWGNGKKIRGNGEVITEQRQADDFDGVSACCAMRVEVTRGNFDVKVEAESNIIEYIETNVSGGRLHIGFKKGSNIKSNEKIVIYVSLPELEYLSASSACKIQGMTAFSGEEIELDASSAAKIDLEFTGRRVRANASSAGSVVVSGSGDRIKANASSAGKVRAGDFSAKRADAGASSGGGVTVNVSEELEADASSGGSVRYQGSPRTVDADKSSGGSVRKLN